jgi:hypothetical protein
MTREVSVGNDTPAGDAMDGYIDQAAAALGGEDSEWLVTARIDKGRPYLYLECRECDREGKPIYSTGQIELWELVVDARSHHEKQHAAAPVPVTGGEGDPG